MWGQPPSAVRRAKPGNCPRPLTSRGARHLFFVLLQERLQKALRHPLHPNVAMPPHPPRLECIKLQRPMLYRKVPALTNIANLNASTTAVPITAQGPGCKPYRVPLPLPRQSRTALRIPKVAELPQLFLRWSFSFMSWRRAVPAPPASQRKPPRMQPIPVLQLLYRHEKRTSHQHAPQKMKS
jgi:hypothetical protein